MNKPAMNNEIHEALNELQSLTTNVLARFGRQTLHDDWQRLLWRRRAQKSRWQKNARCEWRRRLAYLARLLSMAESTDEERLINASITYILGMSSPALRDI